jgi:hypothetical protein
MQSLQTEPRENPDANPSRLTERSQASKRLGDAEEGQFISVRPGLPLEVSDLLQQLDSIEQECRRQLKGERGVLEPNKYYRFTRTGVVYEGEWFNSKPHGLGKNYYPSGGYYEGTFTAGLPNGYGRFINPNGHYYQGEVKCGRGSGEGTYIAGNVLYRGHFKDNVLHGQGEEKGPNYYFTGDYEYGAKQYGILKYSGNVYEGSFEDDVFEGQGTLATPEGRYSGSFHHGLQHGYGEFHWKNGSIYRGHYERGAREGDGEFFNGESKSISRGIWRRGVLEGEGVYQEPRGTSNRVVWREGRIETLR